MTERLQKILARAGLCSRRRAEEWIRQGRVAVEGHIVTQLGTQADPGTQRITVDGRPLRPAEPARYFAFHKPRGVVATLSDPEGRPCLADYLPRGRRGVRERVFPVGRLDFHSEGLLLLTNDGALAQRVLHASAHVPKTYRVKISGRPSPEQLDKLRRGVRLPAVQRPGRAAPAVRTAPAQIRLLPGRAGETENPWLEVVLIEGRPNQIRRMFALIGHPVEKLKRVAIGPLALGQLPPGRLRLLSRADVQALSAPRHGAAQHKSQRN